MSKLQKFKLLAGKHVISSDPLTKAVEGDIVESDRDLVELFGPLKFARVVEEKPAPSAQEETAKLSKKSAAQG